MRTVNLEAILDFHLKLSSQTRPGRAFYLAAMRQACNQTVELCAENAEAHESVGDYPCVSKGSILNTKSQII